MLKRFGLVCLIVALAPGCTLRKKKTAPSLSPHLTHPEPEKRSYLVPHVEGPQQGLADEQIEGFVLDEDENTFGGPLDEDIERDLQMINQQEVMDDMWIDKYLESAQQHTFQTLFFDFDSYHLRPDALGALEYDLKKIQELTTKGYTVVIEGHACKFAGSAEYNVHLSEMRAKAVARYLTNQGIPQDKLKTVGRGSEMCVVVEGDKEQQAPNRRVEFYVLEDLKA